MGFMDRIFGKKKDAPQAAATAPAPNGGAGGLIRALESGDPKRVLAEASALAGQKNTAAGLISLLMAINLQVENLIVGSTQVPKERFVNADKSIRDAACAFVSSARPDLYPKCQILCETLGMAGDPTAGDALFNVASHGYYIEPIRIIAIRSLGSIPGGDKWLEKLQEQERDEGIVTAVKEEMARRAEPSS